MSSFVSSWLGSCSGATSRKRLNAWPMLSALALAACGGVASGEDSISVTEAEVQSNAADSRGEQSNGHHPKGDELFETAFRNTNGRSCASCHVTAEHSVLTPAHVTTLLSQSPSDPLFNPIDADDPSSNPPTYEHLKKGLVRVVLDLPANMDLIDFSGIVVTPPD